MRKVILNMTIFALLAGCAETLQPISNSEKPIENKSLHRNPVLVSSAEMDINQITDAIRIDNNTVVVLNDINNEFDSSAIKNNQTTKSRSLSPINIKSTGVSHLVEQVYYIAGVIGSYSRYEYDLAGIRTKRIYFNDAGIDGEWFTADDVIANYSVFNNQQAQILAYVINYNEAGADAIWFTADDVIQHYIADLSDASGAAVATARYSTAGIDGIWFTTDDDIQFSSSENTRADGSYEWIQYRSAGPDLNWSTLNDNTIGHFALTTPNTSGQNERHVFFSKPGPDGIAYTNDDVIRFYHDYSYNSNNLFSQSIKYGNGPGADAIWFTADDPITRCGSNDFNTDNTTSKSTGTEPGIDAICFTADDVVKYYYDYAYDGTGHLLTSNTFIGTGIDAEWFTADDEIARICKLEAN